MSRASPALPGAFALSLLVVTVAGCIGGPDPTPGLGASDTRWTLTATVTQNGAPLHLAKATVLRGGVPIAIGSTDPSGTLTLSVPGNADRLVVAHGMSALQHTLQDTGPVTIDVPLGAPETFDGTRSDSDAGLGLTVSRITDLGSWQYLYSANAASCRSTALPPDATHDCGLSEPSLEVDGAGTIYYSAVCCVGGAPPIWVSRDDAASWDLLDSPLGQREAFGIEGDFAIDDAGNMYFFDIELAAVQVSAWTADGTHIHTVHQPSIPLVDRPWVRAEGDGTVYIVYNQGIGQSTFLQSTNHGRTFLPTYTFPYNFANIARGTQAGELWATGGIGDAIAVDHSTDGGATWTRATEIPVTSGSWGFIVPVVDTNGTPYVVFDATDNASDAAEPGRRIYVTHARPDGSWTPPQRIGPDSGAHIMPWIAAGSTGKLAVAWYGTLGPDSPPGLVPSSQPWHLMLATTLDGASDEPTWQTIVADPQPVLVGAFTRQLLDFIQVDIGPDGAIHVAYAHQTEGNGNRETPVYLQTLANLPLVDGGILNGPHAD